MRPAAGALLLAAALTLPAAVRSAGLRAERISEASADRLLIGGPDAVGGVGDWYPLLLRFAANGAGMGDTLKAPGGRVRVEIAVGAAPWVPVEELRLLVDGRVARRFRADAQAPPGALRFEREVELSLVRDAFLTLEAGAPLDPQAATRVREGDLVYARSVAPGFVSQLVANPIWIDVDGDGRVTPPAPRRAQGAPDALRRLLVSAAGLLVLAFVWWRLRARAQRSGLRRPL